jgi:hypothetical protein
MYVYVYVCVSGGDRGSSSIDASSVAHNNNNNNNNTLGEFITTLSDTSHASECVSDRRDFIYYVGNNLSTSLVKDLMGSYESSEDDDDDTCEECEECEYTPPSLRGVGVGVCVRVCVVETPLPVLSVGRDSDGFPPHKRPTAWYGLLTGKVTWTFLPPDALSTASFAHSDVGDGGGDGDGDAMDMYVRAALNPPNEWSSDVREVLESRGLLECTQNPSDIIFVPRNWWRATSNVGNVMSIGAQDATRTRRPISNPQAADVDLDLDLDTLRNARSCAATLSSICYDLTSYSSISPESLAIRDVIYEIINSTAHERYRLRAGTGVDIVNGFAECNAVAHRSIAQEVWKLEPLNMEYIIEHAKSYYLYPLEHLGKRSSALVYDSIVSSSGNPALRAAKFILGRVKSVYRYFKKNMIRAVDAKQMIERMGLFMDDLPRLAGAALACPNTPHVTTCGTWGMNDFSHSKYQSILDDMAKLYKKIDHEISKGKDIETSKNNADEL